MDGYFLYIASKLEKLRRPQRRLLDIKGEIKSWDLWRGVIAEGIATMLFVFVGTASIVFPIGETLTSASIVKIAFTFGLMICVLVQMFGHVSGGHINPAVSIAMVVAWKISPLRAILYVIVQCCGGMLGSLILKGIIPATLHSNLGVTGISAVHNVGQGLGCEIVFTFILVFSIFGCTCTDKNRPFFGSPALGIGLTVGVLHLAGIPISGASMNPARSLGPAVVSNYFDNHWIYWVGPIVGGVAAAVLYRFVFDPYRRGPTVDDAANKMLAGEDMIVIPKTYFKDPGSPMKQNGLEFRSKQKQRVVKKI